MPTELEALTAAQAEQDRAVPPLPSGPPPQLELTAHFVVREPSHPNPRISVELVAPASQVKFWNSVQFRSTNERIHLFVRQNP